ncbi:hypothetical protein J2T41_003335 [Pseudomonas citronellolis]|nr:hypothetical protein [Pseudomonas citronellolis]MCP1666632.1 hypothetical protein [Pseudomonas citronellolis]MCP1697196.1 hypothetical protein [Pseudomonas citronellolis]MCP1704171.1 hypothetical protein [Pseudomonas citronellolis]MCP1798322.1 hypothetical protein [Pseudomonas citronellolis]
MITEKFRQNVQMLTKAARRLARRRFCRFQGPLNPMKSAIESAEVAFKALPGGSHNRPCHSRHESPAAVAKHFATAARLQ